jgi:hypothetical protein
MSWKPWTVHLLGLLTISLVTVVLLLTLVPYAARSFFTPPLRGYAGVRFELLYYFTIALIPIGLWLVPSFLRFLARITFSAHKSFLGRSGFYVRLPNGSPPRFSTTLLMSLGPFAIDILAIVEVEHFLGELSTRTRGFYVAPVLLLLAGIITALIPGAWIISELGLRLLIPKTGEVLRASALFDGFLGPLSAVALLVSFITTLAGANYSYETAAFALAVWAVRLFPPVLAAVTIYRMYVEPKVLPSLEAWCDQENIPVNKDLPRNLESMRLSSGPDSK